MKRSAAFHDPLSIAISILVWSIAVAVYSLTISSGPYPGIPAKLLVGSLELAPINSPMSPIWQACARMAALLPSTDVSTAMNYFSVVCGACAVCVMYLLISSIIRILSYVPLGREKFIESAAHLGGAAAALALAFSPPFWFVSNRAHPGSLDALLLLTLAYLLLSIARNASVGKVVGFALLLGAGMAECSTVILFLPVAGLLLVYLIWRQGVMNARMITAIVVGGTFGTSLYFIQAYAFVDSPSWALTGGGTYGSVLLQAWKIQFDSILHGLPRVGWLLVLLLTTVPWVVTVVVGGRGLGGDGSDFGSLILHVILSVVALMVLVNVPFSPWEMFGIQNLLVTPYLLVASQLGYLLAFWLLTADNWRAKRLAGGSVRLSRAAMVVVLAIHLAPLAVMPARNLTAADARNAGVINGLASEILDSLDGRDWLVTDGLIDNNLLLAARSHGKTAKLINLYGGADPLYVKYVGQIVPDKKWAGLAQVGIPTMVHAWVTGDARAGEALAILPVADFWLSANCGILPNKTLFLGGATNGPAAIAHSSALHEEFWRRVGPGLRRLARSQDPLRPLAAHYLRHIGMVANDLGYVLQLAGKNELAYRAYEAALDLDTNNVSALMNQYELSTMGFGGGDRASLQAALEKVTGGKTRVPSASSLSATYGYVHSAEMFMALGLEWARSGNPSGVAMGLETAARMSGDESPGAMKNLAQILLSQNAFARSAEIFAEVLAKDPRDVSALLGLARANAQRGQFKTAGELIDRAEGCGSPAEWIALERAVLATLSGRFDQARTLLDRFLTDHPDHAFGWGLLSDIAIRTSDHQTAAKCISKLRSLPESNFVVMLSLGEALLFEQREDEGRQCLEKALRLRPDAINVLDRLVRMDVREARLEEGYDHVRRLLQFMPNDPFANWILGTIQAHRGEYRLSESSLRRSLEIKGNAAVWNDLAWVLWKSGQYREAEDAARSSLKMNDLLPAAWDTLGVILLSQSRLAEAEESLAKSATLFDRDPLVKLHLAEVYVREGKVDKARALLESLKAHVPRFSAEDKKTYADLQSR